MRIFLFYSNTLRTDGNFKDIYHSGRVDIIIHSIIHSFFISNGLRKYVIFDLFSNAKPNNPLRIKIESNIDTPWSKKDIATLLSISIKKFLLKRKNNPFPGIYIEKKDFLDILQEYVKSGRNLYLLDKGGEFIENIKIEDPVFILGDFLGIPKDIKKEIDAEIISIGDINYFTSQVIVLLNWFLDKMNYYKDYYDTSFKFENLKKKYI